MNDAFNKVSEKVKEVADGAKELANENKGAILGGIAMYLLSSNEQLKSAVLGAIGGKLLVDDNKKSEDE